MTLLTGIGALYMQLCIHVSRVADIVMIIIVAIEFLSHFTWLSQS